MIVIRHRPLIVTILALFALGLGPAAWPQGFSSGHQEAFGPHFKVPHDSPQPQPPRGEDEVRRWNEIALRANAIDHTPVAPSETRVFGEQLGPGRTARALAIVHLAIFEAVNAIASGYQSYAGLPPAPPGTSMAAAVAQAGHDTLVALYPSQRASFDAQLADDLRQPPFGRPQHDGITLGQRTAAAILALRADDGAQHMEPKVGNEYVTSEAPGRWRPDPISQSPLALGTYWGKVMPFVLPSATHVPAPPPPPLASPAYAAAFDEVQRLGGDGIVTPTERTAEQTEIGIYWGYDGTPGLGTPPRLYNQIAVAIADQMDTGAVELARLLALVNVALADTGIAVWKAKYLYDYWRPVTGIREADAGTGPTGAGDGNPETAGDPTFTPLGAPASNYDGPNFTPPFPAYPSGHAAFGGALFETLRQFYETDDIPFTFVSDEFNGVTQDNEGTVRPLVSRSFATLTEAEEENGQSRMYLGIHWAFDKTAGSAQGRQVADYVFQHAFLPQP